MYGCIRFSIVLLIILDPITDRIMPMYIFLQIHTSSKLPDLGIETMFNFSHCVGYFTTCEYFVRKPEHNVVEITAFEVSRAVLSALRL